MTPSSLKPLVRLRSSLLHLYEVQNKHCSDQLLAYMPRGTLSGLRIASGRFLWLDCSKLSPLAPQIDKYSIGLGLTISLYLACISRTSRYTRDTTRLRDPKRSNRRQGRRASSGSAGSRTGSGAFTRGCSERAEGRVQPGSCGMSDFRDPTATFEKTFAKVLAGAKSPAVA